MKTPDDAKPVSIQIRLQRTTIEYSYVNIEITPEVMTNDNHLDSNKIFQLAIEYGDLPQVEWYRDQQAIEPHPVQKEREPHEKSLYKGQDGIELI
jgi:hypothetical protein